MRLWPGTRTGKFFGFEHDDTAPDIMTPGKGLRDGCFPLGDVAAAKPIDYIRENSLVSPWEQMGNDLAENSIDH